MPNIQRIPIVSRDAWLQCRRQDLTASDVGAAAGESRYKTRLGLWGEKTGRLLPAEDNPAMQRGRWLEPAVVAAVKETYPDWQIGYPLGLYVRDADISLGCTPDAIAEIPGRAGITNLQLKVVSRSAFNAHWHREGIAQPPLEYQLQTACEAMLLDTHDGMVAALIIDQWGAELRTFEVPRLPRLETFMRDLAVRFWADIRNGIKPPATVEDVDTIDAVYPVETDAELVRLDGDNMLPELMLERLALKETIHQADKRCDEIDTLVKDKIGDYAGATIPGWKITWKHQDRKQYTVAAKTIRPFVVYDRRRAEGLLPPDEDGDTTVTVAA